MLSNQDVRLCLSMGWCLCHATWMFPNRLAWMDRELGRMGMGTSRMTRGMMTGALAALGIGSCWPSPVIPRPLRGLCPYPRRAKHFYQPYRNLSGDGGKRAWNLLQHSICICPSGALQALWPTASAHVRNIPIQPMLSRCTDVAIQCNVCQSSGHLSPGMLSRGWGPHLHV